MNPLNEILRETRRFYATRNPKTRAIRVCCLDANAAPQSRRVSAATWRQLSQMNDSEFDGSATLELGVGVFQKGKKTPRNYTTTGGR